MNSKIICVLNVLCFLLFMGCSFIFDSSDLMGEKEQEEQNESILGSDAASTDKEADPKKEKPPSDTSSDQQNENPDTGVDVTGADAGAGSIDLDSGNDDGVPVTGGTDDTGGIDTNLDSGIDGGVRGIGGIDTDDNAGEKDSRCAPPNCPGLDWVTIEGGTFMMGSTDEEVLNLFGAEAERPRHEVMVQTFKMSKTEVTVAQFRMCVNAGICSEPFANSEDANWGKSGRESYPINYMDWNQARKFAQWSRGRLPSEAEWEYAARNGRLDYVYPWGNEDATCEHAVIRQDASHNDCVNESTMAVCSKRLGNTTDGLCDMVGNVWEWVEDDYHDSYNGAPSDGQAWIDNPRSDRRVVRGGSRGNDPLLCRSAARRFNVLNYSDYLCGFRVVQDIK